MQIVYDAVDDIMIIRGSDYDSAGGSTTKTIIKNAVQEIMNLVEEEVMKDGRNKS